MSVKVKFCTPCQVFIATKISIKEIPHPPTQVFPQLIKFWQTGRKGNLQDKNENSSWVLVSSYSTKNVYFLHLLVMLFKCSPYFLFL